MNNNNNNNVFLSNEYQLNHRSWSNSRGYGNVKISTEQGFRISPYNRLTALPEPTATNVTKELSWTSNNFQSCVLPDDNAPRVPMRSIDFDVSKFNCLG